MPTHMRLGVCLSLLALVVLSGWVVYRRIAHRPAAAPGSNWGLTELSRRNLTLYVSQSGIYRLDTAQAHWIRVMPHYSGHTEQDVAIRDGHAYYRSTDGIYGVSITGGNDTPALLDKIAFSPDTLAISWDGRSIAYRKYLDDMFQHQAVVVRDLQSGEEKSFPVNVAPQGICWSGDDRSLVMGLDDQIVRLLLDIGDQEAICQGYSPQTLRDGSVCYGRARDVKGQRCLVFFRRDAGDGCEKEIACVPVAGFQTASFDPEGRFLAVGYIARTRLISFDFATAVELIDLETGKRCWLPPFDNVTRCMLWQSSKDPNEHGSGEER